MGGTRRRSGDVVCLGQPGRRVASCRPLRGGSAGAAALGGGLSCARGCPGLGRLARTTAADDPDAIDEVVSLGWERIRTYPPDRPGPVAANVVLDVRKRYRRYRRRTAIRSVDLAAVAGTSRGHGRPAEDEALDRLAMNEWLVRQRALVGERCYRAVVRTGVWGLSLAEHAAEEDTTVSIIYQRRWRAMQRMRPLPLGG